MTKPVKSFLTKGFLLRNPIGALLYKEFASAMPILDFHNHLSPRDIALNRQFKNITEALLEGDHYKWRAMRINGVSEKFCTGDASPEEKFMQWSRTVPYTMRNPLYHWTHLELKNYFGVTTLLDGESAQEIYQTCSAMLQKDEFRTQSLLTRMNVEVVCTTDDPADTLEYHQQFAGQSTSLKMYPSFRPDKSYVTDSPTAYREYVERLSLISKSPIQTFDDLIGALVQRMSFFNDLGCRSADHGPNSLYFDPTALTEAPLIFKKVFSGKDLTGDEKLKFRCAVLTKLCEQYHRSGWVQQFHVGALRNNNTRMLRLLGPDTGFDSIGEFPQADHMARFFDSLDNTNQLAKTIIYNSNPAHNEVFATMTGNFSDGSSPGKIQFGSGWWFLDQKDGMEKQLNTLSTMGLLSRFVGMITDSRSVLSFPRHEYFRRILCNLIGQDVANGELPEDLPLLGQMVKDICYFNAKEYFKF
jgi:glucuronate isomerase